MSIDYCLLFLFKLKVLKIWLFDSNWQFIKTKYFDPEFSSATDFIEWRNGYFLVYSNTPFIWIKSKDSKPLFLRYSNDKMSVKVSDFDDDYYNFKSQLNGHRISAATDVTLNDTTFVYLFAGRMLCRQELSEQFVKVCDIEDIADWIDCTNDADIPGKPGISWFIIVLSFGVIVLLIVVITLTVFLIKRRYDKHNEGPTLRFIYNASTANLRSDIPSPKRRESNEVLMSKKSKVTINKKIENSETTASISDL